MELKKAFEKPEIEVIEFNAMDVITASNENFASTCSYDIDSIRNFFNIKV